MLITRPNHDITTSYLYYWSEPVIAFARAKNRSVIDLKGKNATPVEFTGRVKKTNPAFVILNGHGNSKTIGGQDNTALVDMKNADILSGRVTFARACSAAKNLGVVAVNGGGSFIGYDDDFVFQIDEMHVSKPLRDRIAALFLEPSNHVAISLLKGHTSGQSVQRANDLFREIIHRALSSDATDDEKDALPYLIWDMKHQVCVGDQSMTI